MKIKFDNSIPITPEERSLLVETIAERLKNVVYMEALPTTSNSLRSLGVTDKIPGHYSNEDSFDFTFKITMIVGDIKELIGGVRRKGSK